NGKAVLAEQRRDQRSIRDPEDGLHQPARYVKRRERDLERVEIEEKENPRGPLVHGQDKAPVLDLAARIRPLEGVLITEFHEIGVAALAIDKVPGDASLAHAGLVGNMNAIAATPISWNSVMSTPTSGRI